MNSLDVDKMFIAVNRLDLPEVKKFIAAGVDVNALNSNRRTMIYVAVVSNRVVKAANEVKTKIVKLLLEAGALPIDNVDSSGDPLFEAVSRNYFAIAKMLVEAGFPLNQGGDFNYTPLHRSVESRNPKIVELLLTAGADTTRKTVGGYTALALLKRLSRKDYIKNPILELFAAAGVNE